MPPALAARFTTGELAVMRIVGDEFQAHQACVICLDAIAARAGVSRTLAKSAIRQARCLGMVEVRERRRAGAKSLPNVVTVIDREWLAWMARRSRIGGKKESTTDKNILGSKRATKNRDEVVHLPERVSLSRTQGLKRESDGLLTSAIRPGTQILASGRLNDLAV